MIIIILACMWENNSNIKFMMNIWVNYDEILFLYVCMYLIKKVNFIIYLVLSICYLINVWVFVVICLLLVSLLCFFI